MALEFNGVRVEHEGRLVLDIPSLRIQSGRTTAILGPNGSGKTTLLRVIAGLERPRAGHVRSTESAPTIAYVFQEHVFLRRSVRENLGLGLQWRGLKKDGIGRRVEDAARFLGVGHLLDRRADQLSGGEARRVSLARALCLQAPLVLLDEPLGGLDERTHLRLLDELPQLLTAFNATTLLVTHSRQEALRLAEDLVVIVQGRVYAAGNKRDVVTNPQVRTVAEVLGHTVITINGRSVAIPPGGLQMGPGGIEFTMSVDGVLDLVDHQEVAGRIGDAIVRLRVPISIEAPKPGTHVIVHSEQASEIR